MTFNDLRRKSLKSLKDPSAVSESDVSDCTYDAIQEMQINTLCSRMEVKRLIDVNRELSAISIIDGGSGYENPPTVTISDNILSSCVNFGGINGYGAVSPAINISTTHTIEASFILSSVSSTSTIMGASSVSDSLRISSGSAQYYVGGVSVSFAYTFDINTFYIIFLIRSGTSVSLYVNNTFVSTQTLGANNNFNVERIAHHTGAQYFKGKMGRIRAYSSVITSDQRTRQWNSGYGNNALDDVTTLFDFEFDGNFGTAAVETDASGLSLTCTLQGDYSRSTWGDGYSDADDKAKASAFIENGVVTSVVVTNSGRGYFAIPSVSFSGGGGTGAIAVAEIATTTYDKIITSKFGGSTTGDIDVECLYVDSMYRVGLDGTKNPIKITNRQSIQDERDNGANYNDASDYTAAIEWNKNNIHIFTPWDMTGSTIELWIRFQIPYIQNDNVGANADSYLDTIPVQFQNRLVSGVKYHIYESMEEMSGFSGKYKPMMDIFGNQWFNRDLPYVKQEANHSRTSADVHIIRPSGVF